MAYRIEHIGLCVSDPVAMAEWYQRVLGFNIVFSGADQEKAVAFVTDGSHRAGPGQSLPATAVGITGADSGGAWALAVDTFVPGACGGFEK